MNWIFIIEIVYLLMVAGTCLLIIYDTDNTPKTLAYLLLTFFLPVAGMLFYLFFGINYRKRKRFEKKLLADELTLLELRQGIVQHSRQVLHNGKEELQLAAPLVNMLLKDSFNPLTTANMVQLLHNGEEKFPALLQAMQAARHHIHLEYYIIEDDAATRQLQALLLQKLQEGVQVRLIYDAFGAKNIRGAFAQQLRQAGAEVYPFNKIRWFFLASKINYRNHRKIAVIDGVTGFVGGINLCQKYINTHDAGRLYWRDTHLRIQGPAVWHLQHIFLRDWNFCSGQQLGYEVAYFTPYNGLGTGVPVQMVAGGPDCPRSVIMLSMLKAINLARRYCYITTPYFIPDSSMVAALKLAALSGVDVRLLVPGISDSKTVNAAAKSYYQEILKAGVKVYLYQRGFVHAKTMVIDDSLAVIGTANMDIRSFDINFEVNANVYDAAIARELAAAFLADISFAEALDYESWCRRPYTAIWGERVARLLSPLL